MRYIVIIDMVLTGDAAVTSVAGHLEGASCDEATAGRLFRRWINLETKVTHAVVSDNEDSGVKES